MSSITRRRGRTERSRTLSLQITDRIERACGLRMTAHQFRHVVAAIFLKEHRGEYELARQFLGARASWSIPMLF